MQIENQQYKDFSLDRICKIRLSDESTILIDKTIMKKYRKYAYCVFIDFEYINTTVEHVDIQDVTLRDSHNANTNYSKEV